MSILARLVIPVLAISASVYAAATLHVSEAPPLGATTALPSAAPAAAAAIPAPASSAGGAAALAAGAAAAGAAAPASALLEAKTKAESRPFTLSILGAPAAGKSFYRAQLEKIWQDVKQAETLTVDMLRDDLLVAPTLIKLYEVFKTYEFVSRLAKENPREYEKWLNEYVNSVSSILLNLTAEILNLRLNVSLTESGGFKFRRLVADGSKEITLYEFMRSIEPILPDLEEEVFGKRAYSNLKRTVRKIQAEAIASSATKHKHIVFDESGDDAVKFIDRLKPFHSGHYNNYVIMIHPETILINYLQNASRMILGSDGGRDSSSAIFEAYNAIDQGVKREGGLTHVNYADLRNTGTFRAITLPSPTEGELERVFTDFMAQARGLAPSGDKRPIDYVLWLNVTGVDVVERRLITEKFPALVKELSAERITTTTENLRDLLYSILKVQLSNPSKINGKLIKDTQDRAPGFWKALGDISIQAAYTHIVNAAVNKLSPGIGLSTIIEAETVWPGIRNDDRVAIEVRLKRAEISASDSVPIVQD